MPVFINIKNVCFEWRILKEDVKMKNQKDVLVFRLKANT